MLNLENFKPIINYSFIYSIIFYILFLTYNFQLLTIKWQTIVKFENYVKYLLIKFMKKHSEAE